MQVRFREVDPFGCWLWLRFPQPLSEGERGYVEGVFDSWFVLGKLGGFNAGCLQVHESGGDISWLAYNTDDASQALPALMHAISGLELRGEWARCWVDLGTSDSLALDVLINALRQLDRDVVEILELVVGGVNDDWPLEEEQQLSGSWGGEADDDA
ncbi:MAG: DUF3531 family protein [Cyanobacteriota bacterium]|jgi:hypothetical protein|nr:DUF3531 family protein [Cyanobacteriota bacterium]